MNENKILLSICIATYNRAHYLKECLSSIYIQTKDNINLNNIIEIVISDNSSEDNTEEIAEEFSGKFNNFVYTKNERNLGFDLNVVNVVLKSSGKYCWYLGDDDLIANGAIDYISTLLNTGKYDFVGTGSVQENLIKGKKDSLIEIKSKLLETTDPNECYFDNYCQGGFSVLIFNRDSWIKSLDTNDYINHWLYYETILRLIINSNKFFAYAPDQIIITGQDCRWAENGNELYTYINSNILKKKMILWGYDKNRMSNELQNNSKKLPIILLRAKGHGLSYETRHLRYIFKNMKTAGFINLFISLFIFYIPNSVVKFIRDTRKKILNNE